MGRAGHIYNTHAGIEANRGHRRMQRALPITATPEKLGLNSMAMELLPLQNLAPYTSTFFAKRGPTA